MNELVNNSINGINIIPTALLGFVLLYWITVIIGVIDIDLFDFDMDIDMNVDNDLSGFEALLAFLNVKELPFMLVFSVIVLNFWILCMLIPELSIVKSNIIHSLLMIASLFISMIITKIVTMPLKGLFKRANEEEEKIDEPIVGARVTVNCDITENRLGQAEVERDGASILINVKAYNEGETFKKNQEAFVIKKDKNKNLYYIVNIEEDKKWVIRLKFC